MSPINVCLVGCGNVVSALVQGIEKYKHDPDFPRIGILPEITQYAIEDIQFVLAIDVNANKVGKDLSEAIFVAPNNTVTIYRPEPLDCPVVKGPVLDGLDSKIQAHVPVSEAQAPVDVVQALKDRRVDVMCIAIPTGSTQAAEFYAKAAIEAGVSVMNGMPSLLANNPEIVGLAEKAGVSLIGDDVKSQIGATIIHRGLANLFPARGAILDRTIQLDWGGDMDFCNLMSSDRYEQGKRQSKTESVVANLQNKDSVECQISAVDYIPFLENQKEAYMRVEGRIFGGVGVRVDITMQVIDGYNSAGIHTDAIRVLKVAQDKGHAGVVQSASSFFAKKPPEQLEDYVARKNLIEFLQG